MTDIYKLSSLERHIFSLFRAPASSVKPCATATIADAYIYITTSERARKATNGLRAIDDRDEARRYKTTHFDFACFSGTFSHRSDKSLVSHSGLICLDFDHVGDSRALSALRRRLLADPYFTTWLLFTSPSGDGLKWVVDIDLECCDHRTWFRALQRYVSHTYAFDIDRACANESRACFLPYDAEAYIDPSLLPLRGAD